MVKKLLHPKALLLLAILITVFFRLYRTEDFFGFGHDQDLAAWIAKDVLVDGHLRLIGQETSVTGIFIGPLGFYWLMIFYAIFGMQPESLLAPILIISIATLLSIYFVVSKLFNNVAALIASFIYASSLSLAFLDRWVVPTHPSLLWTMWYFYTLISFLRGNFRPFPLLLVLVALIWHVHIAFFPLLILIPISLILSKKRFNFSEIRFKSATFILAAVTSIILFLPLFAFEIRHGFQQFQGFKNSLIEERGGVKGWDRFELVLKDTVSTFESPFYYDKEGNFSKPGYLIIVGLVFIFIYYLVIKKKLISSSEAILLATWVISVMVGQFLSKRTISEYYLNNLIILSITLVALFLSNIYKSSTRRYLVYLFLLAVLIISFNKFNSLTADGEYFPIKKTVEYIRADSVKKGYPCLAVNFFGRPGAYVGFRFPLWLSGVNVVTPHPEIPIYNVAVPSGISSGEVDATFGNYGVILPQPNNFNFDLCDDPGRQLPPPNGFTN